MSFHEQHDSSFAGASQDAKIKNSTSKLKRTGGVADYFAILGVGDDLLWKHTQKQREEQQLLEQQQQHHHQQQPDNENNMEAPENSRDPDPNQEDEAALMERFYREIIDVAILSHVHSNQSSNYNHNNQHHNSRANAPASSILLPSSPSHDTDVDGSVASNARPSTPLHHLSHHSQQQPHPSILPSPSSHSEATTVATTVLSASDAATSHQAQAWQLPSEIDGFTLLSRTPPPQPAPNPPIHAEENGWNESQQQQQQQQPPATSSASSFTQNSNSSVPALLPWNTKTGYQVRHHSSTTQGTDTTSSEEFVFEANLETSGGLREHVCTTVLQWEERHGDSFQAAEANKGKSSSRGAPLKGLRRKVESSWKRWSHLADFHTRHPLHASSSPTLETKFFVGYKRRTPDQDNVPAVADIKLLYVRLPRQATTRPHCLPSALAGKSASPPGSSSGLAGRVVAAAGHVLFRHHRDEVDTSISSQVEASSAASGTIEEATLQYEHVDLEASLVLPKGFDHWSIPEAFRVIYIPMPQHEVPSKETRTPARKPLREKTVLMASPSHGGRKPASQNSKDSDFHAPPPSNVGSTTSSATEAVEAYVTASYSQPNSPTSQDCRTCQDGTEAKLKNEHMQTKANAINEFEGFYPQLFTDIPWEDDHEQASQQYHHPYFHAEEKWWYLPVLAIRRQRTGDEERYHEDPGIVDLAVSFCDRSGLAVLPQEHENFSVDDIMMMEKDEDKFSLLSKTPWLVSSEGDNRSAWESPDDLTAPVVGLKRSKSRKFIRTVRKALGSPALLVKRNVAIGFADLAFATNVLDRFPLKNYKGLPLPEEELPMFCYPTGCRLHRERFSDAPLPEYYGFVVKNEKGDSIYVSCVSFMEPLTRQKIEQLSNMSEKRRRTSLAHRRYCEKRVQRRMRKEGHKNCSDESRPVPSEGPEFEVDGDSESENWILTGFDTMTTFEKKTICVVSRFPFWTAFRRFLSHLHILSSSSSDLPLERCISHLLLTVPVPKPGGPNVIVPLPALNQPMILSLPPLKDFPLVDLPYHRLMACLDIPTIVTVVLGFLALERKVLVMSTRPSLVLDACELLRSLLFPFDLCAPYVPRLTEPFMSCLEFPGAIFGGIHDDGSPEGLASVVRKSPPEDSIIVDLDTGSIDCSGNRYEVLTGAWNIMPPSARSMLISELETLCRDTDLIPGQEPLDSLVDSAFDATLPSGLVDDFDILPDHNPTKEPLDDRAIRDAFLRFFCDVLRGYERYLVVPDADFLISGNEWFDTQEFLSSASKENTAYLNSFVSTQLFQSFIQRRTEDSDVHCLLFDECLAEYHSSPVPYGRLGGDVETVVSHDHSHMLYSLLVDQSASAPHCGSSAPTFGSMIQDHSNVERERSIGDDGSIDGEDSAFDSGSYALAKPSLSTVTDISEKGKIAVDGSDLASIQNSESIVTAAGDIITAPQKSHLPAGVQYIYCVDGQPCFPHRLNKSLFLPREPDSWLVEMSKIAPSPSLARSEREVEEANRRRKAAISYRGFHTQKRCLWQLPKLMGSHFLGSWLLCIPSQVAQPELTRDQQSRFLLRALGAIRLLRHKQRIIPDEAAYRALMVACGRTSSDRRADLVKLFGLLRSDGIFPSAVTLGQYTRALAEGYSKRAAADLSEETVNDFSGVEVTESMSLVRGSGRSSIGGSTNGIESSLFAMDGNLGNLEHAGRRWRRGSGPERPGQKAPSGQHSSSAAQSNKIADERHHRKRHRSWLPVVVASSFVPSQAHGNNSSFLNSGLIPKESVQFVALWSRTCACDSCGYIPLEEEVQAGWDTLRGENDVLGAISCARCGTMIIPMLGYREMSVEDALALKEPSPQNIYDDADFAGMPPQLGPYIDHGQNKASFVTYISPDTLRLSIERYINEIGESVLSRDRLKALDPEVFWNFFWYCARFNLPLPLPIIQEGEEPPNHVVAFAAWERTAAERGCYSGAKAIAHLLTTFSDATSKYLESSGQYGREMGAVDPYDDYPLLSRYNLQGFHPTVWDHPDLSEILVSLVTVCDSDRRDFKMVLECVLRCNRRRREAFGDAITENGSDVNFPVDIQPVTEGALSPCMELDCYRTILYLAKYQCTTAFHTFFPAVGKPCKGYHFWCAIGTPLPIFDRLLREAAKRVNSKENTFAPIPDVSDVALGFRCVFGHLI